MLAFLLQILIQGHYYFVPLTLGKFANYLDLLIIVISVGVSSYKVRRGCIFIFAHPNPFAVLPEGNLSS